MAARNGSLALVGSGEFLPSMRRVDSALLERAGGSRVVVLPTAAAPDGPGIPERWADAGVRHFSALGAEASAVMALDRAGCSRLDLATSVRNANLVYFSGGKPGHLWSCLIGTPLWGAVLEVLETGGVVAGCSAGAMILGSWIPARFSFRRLSFWTPASGLVPDAVVIPHFDELPSWTERLVRRVIPRKGSMVGIDGGTALVVRGDHREVLGRGRVVWVQDGKRNAARAGQPLPPGPAG